MVIKDVIERSLDQQVTEVKALSGGDINEVYFCSAGGAFFVVKINNQKDFPQMFLKEAKGLDLIRSAGCIAPKVIGTFVEQEYQLLIMEYIPEEPSDSKYWVQFGRQLSILHGSSSINFGLQEDNYIGSLPQKNDRKESWANFFVECRLEPMVSLAYDQQRLTSWHLEKFAKLYAKIELLIPKEKPSLLHGDLWSGNLMCGKGGQPVFIDPAVYYGHREVDLAMTQLFGGFNSRFLDSYNEAFPLEKGWKERLKIHNIYPNLVHLNLFGTAYLGNIERVLDQYT